MSETQAGPRPGARRITITGVAAAAMAAAFTIAAPSSFAAAPGTPPQTGCPAGWETLTLDWLATQGPYVVPGLIDGAGNNDYVVCGRPINDVEAQHICGGPCRVPVLYDFRDNDLTPRH